MSERSDLNFSLVDAAPGQIALSICPGRHEPGQTPRDLDDDLNQLVDAGASIVVSLTESEELERLGVLANAISAACARRNVEWLHLPIRDMGVPDDRFTKRWQHTGPALHRCLDAGETVVLHCRGGLGRSGTIAAQLLIERGAAPVAAKAIVRAARPGAIETCPQSSYLLTLV